MKSKRKHLGYDAVYRQIRLDIKNRLFLRIYTISFIIIVFAAVAGRLSPNHPLLLAMIAIGALLPYGIWFLFTEEIEWYVQYRVEYSDIWYAENQHRVEANFIRIDSAEDRRTQTETTPESLCDSYPPTDKRAKLN